MPVKGDNLMLAIIVQPSHNIDDIPACGLFRSKIMAVEATGSRFSRNNNLILAVVCLAAAAWFGYDGWLGQYRQDQLDKNEQKIGVRKPTVNLYINQYIPVVLLPIAVFNLIGAAKCKSRKIVADDKAVTLSDGRQIVYDSISKIDRRLFEKSGRFTIEYTDSGRDKLVKFDDRKYDNLGILLDEIIKQTGASPSEKQHNQNA